MPFQTVFVYGSLKRGFRNHRFMGRARFVAEGLTRPEFAMLDLGRYPGVIRGNSAIQGEVFAVAPPLMVRLDRLEDNGWVYQRERITIDVPSGPVDAWIYLYLQERRHRKRVKPQDGVVTWREPAGSPAQRR